MAAIIVALHHAPAEGACANNRYTITGGTDVTMGDASALLPFTITNSSNSDDPITFVRLEFDSHYYNISLMSTAPTGWTISQIKNAGQGQTYIEYTATSGGIAVNGSLTFYVMVTGLNNTKLPSANSDVSDTLDSGTRVRNGGCTFTRDGGFPTWTRRALAATISATPLSTGTGGTITIIFTVTNRSSAIQSNVGPYYAPPQTFGTSTGGIFGPNPPSATLAIGASATFQWTYTAGGSGSIQFCDSATNSSGTAGSISVCSNIVSVGNFTAYITVSPSQVVSGQEVTVRMTVTNNGTSPIQNIKPTLSVVPLGSTNVSGPPPNYKIASLNEDSSFTVEWVYRLTGSVGDVFTFSGYATDNNGSGVRSVPDPAVSNAVTISAYSVTVAPNQVSSGSTNVTFIFTVRNNGGNGLNRIYIDTPTTGFVYSSASGGCSGSWNVGGGGTPREIRFTTNSDYVPAGGGVCDFSVTYSSVPTVGANTDYNFIIVIYDTASGGTPRGSLGALVKVTTYNVAVLTDALSAIGPNCIAHITAEVTPSPGAGMQVTFLETAGILDPHVTETDSNGRAFSVLTAPNPYYIPSATITATYLDAHGSVTVLFTGTGSCAAVRILDWREVVR